MKITPVSINRVGALNASANKNSVSQSYQSRPEISFNGNQDKKPNAARREAAAILLALGMGLATAPNVEAAAATTYNNTAAYEVSDTMLLTAQKADPADKTDKEYQGGKLVKKTVTHKDGSKDVYYNFNSRGQYLSRTRTTADGKVYQYEHEFDSKGALVKTTKTSPDKTVNIYTNFIKPAKTTDSINDLIPKSRKLITPSGKVYEYTYEYDQANNLSKTTEKTPDGTVNVYSDYYKNTEPTKKKTTKPDGKVYDCTYEYATLDDVIIPKKLTVKNPDKTTDTYSYYQTLDYDYPPIKQKVTVSADGNVKTTRKYYEDNQNMAYSIKVEAQKATKDYQKGTTTYTNEFNAKGVRTRQTKVTPDGTKSVFTYRPDGTLKKSVITMPDKTRYIYNYAEDGKTKTSGTKINPDGTKKQYKYN